MEFKELEQLVMEKLLSGDDPVLQILREQYLSVQRTEYEFTGVGFFATFEISKKAPILSGGISFHLGDVDAEVNDGTLPVGFVLFVTDGALDMLEGYTYGDKWPKQIINIRLRYINGEERDLDKLRLEWTRSN